MKMSIIGGLAAIGFAASSGFAMADPIEGMWKRPADKGGTLEKISACGGAYCVVVASGKFNGKQAGKFTASGGGKYVGEITDLEAQKTYSGSGTLNGNSLVMKGCVAKIFCRSETWTRM